LLNALNLLIPEPLVRHHGPSTLQVTVNEQQTQNRWIVHLLHYIPERRSQTIDILEDVIPLYQVSLSVKTARAVKSIALVPQQEDIPFQQGNDKTQFIVPRLDGHQMVEIKFTSRSSQ